MLLVEGFYMLILNYTAAGGGLPIAGAEIEQKECLWGLGCRDGKKPGAPSKLVLMGAGYFNDRA